MSITLSPRQDTSGAHLSADQSIPRAPAASPVELEGGCGAKRDTEVRRTNPDEDGRDSSTAPDRQPLASSGTVREELPSPYLGATGSPPTNGNGDTAASTDDPGRRDSPEPIHLDASGVSASITDDPVHTPTPPGSPLRSFIAPAAQAGPVAAPAARLPAPRPPKAALQPLPLPHTSAIAGPSTASTSAVRQSPHLTAAGAVWQTGPSSARAPQQAEKAGEDDVDMEEDVEEEGEDELDSEYYDEPESSKAAKARRAPAVSSKPPQQGPASAGTGPAGSKAQAKRVTRGPGKKQVAKAKERELQKEKENVRVEAARVAQAEAGGDGMSEAGGKEGKGDVAYEYVAVSQVSYESYTSLSE